MCVLLRTARHLLHHRTGVRRHGFQGMLGHCFAVHSQLRSFSLPFPDQDTHTRIINSCHIPTIFPALHCFHFSCCPTTSAVVTERYCLALLEPTSTAIFQSLSSVKLTMLGRLSRLSIARPSARFAHSVPAWATVNPWTLSKDQPHTVQNYGQCPSPYQQ